MKIIKNDTLQAISNQGNKLRLLVGLDDKYRQLDTKLNLIDTNNKKDKHELTKVIDKTYKHVGGI